MMCPKCQEGELLRIEFKKTNTCAFVCNFCDTMWFADEEISALSGHPFANFSNDSGKEYVANELPEKDQDHQVIFEKGLPLR